MSKKDKQWMSPMQSITTVKDEYAVGDIYFVQNESGETENVTVSEIGYAEDKGVYLVWGDDRGLMFQVPSHQVVSIGHRKMIG